MTNALRKLITEAEEMGWTFENSHSQFFTLKGTGRRRDYCIFLNANGGFAHGYAVRNGDSFGPGLRLASIRRCMAEEFAEASAQRPTLTVVR